MKRDLRLSAHGLRLAVGLMLASFSHVGAQRPSRASRPPLARGLCRVDTTAAWYRDQRAWFDDSKGGWKNDSLRHQLLAAAGLESLPGAANYGWQVSGRDPAVSTKDSAIIDRLKHTGRADWPTKGTVGALGSHATYLLALRDTGLTRVALHPFMEAGPDQSPAPDVATLEDRNRLIVGRKQIYGTQFRLDAGTVVLQPMEDSAHADLRREDARLPPFALSACLARAAGQGQ